MQKFPAHSFLKTGCTCSVFSVHSSGVRKKKVSWAKVAAEVKMIDNFSEMIRLEAVCVVNAWQRKENNPFNRMSQDF